MTPSNLAFIGEQVGPKDDQFKARRRRLFAQGTPVFRRAYLARISYGEPAVVSVALCYRYVESIEHELQRGFKYMFGSVRHGADLYDSMVIGEEQELELKKVCNPFYEAP